MILSLASEHFYAMFCNKGFKESMQEEVEFKDISISSFEMLLEFVYTGMCRKINSREKKN